MNTRDLETLGLSSKEARVYLALLEIGNDTALAISERSAIPKSTVHDILKNLTAMGLVSHYQKKNKRIFSAGDPALLTSKLEKQQRTLERILPELNLFYGAKEKKPRVRFYESRQGIEVAIKEMILESKEMLFISSWVSTYETFPEFLPKAAEQRVKYGVRARALVTQEEGVEGIQAKDREMLRETRLLPEKIKLKADVWIWNNKAVFYDVKGKPSVLIVEDESIVDLLTQMFEMLWVSSETKSS